MRRFTVGLGALLAVALLMLAAPDPLRAQNHQGQGIEAEEHKLTGDEHGSKSPLRAEWTNIITTVVVFGLLLVILRVFAWKPILTGLQKREENIRGALEAAQEAKAAAERAQQEFRQRMAENDAKIAAEFDKARQQAQQLAADFRADAEAKLKDDRQRLQREIETAKDQAMQEIWRQAVELAALMSTKALGRQVSAEDHGRLVDEALAELRQGNGRGRA